MIWVASDVHGCLDEYGLLLEKLQLQEDDRLYMLGDAIDRGPDSIPVLVDILERPNIRYIPGNHDYFLRRLGPRYGFTRKEGARTATPFDIALYAGWMLDAGRSTLEQFRRLPTEKRRWILDRLNRAPAFVELETAGKTFVLTHKARPGFEKKPHYASVTLMDYLIGQPDYSRPYFSDGRVVVSGHKWTAEIRPDHTSRIYTDVGHIAIDCGCVFGGHLAACCLETGESVYVKSAISR